MFQSQVSSHLQLQPFEVGRHELIFFKKKVVCCLFSILQFFLEDRVEWPYSGSAAPRGLVEREDSRCSQAVWFPRALKPRRRWTPSRVPRAGGGSALRPLAPLRQARSSRSRLVAAVTVYIRHSKLLFPPNPSSSLFSGFFTRREENQVSNFFMI